MTLEHDYRTYSHCYSLFEYTFHFIDLVKKARSIYVKRVKESQIYGNAWTSFNSSVGTLFLDNSSLLIRLPKQLLMCFDYNKMAFDHQAQIDLSPFAKTVLENPQCHETVSEREGQIVVTNWSNNDKNKGQTVHYSRLEVIDVKSILLGLFQ